MASSIFVIVSDGIGVGMGGVSVGVGAIVDVGADVGVIGVSCCAQAASSSKIGKMLK
jgi:hypothetical protein